MADLAQKIAQGPVNGRGYVNSMDKILQQRLGVDPSLAYRGAMLPFGRTAGGKTELALPQFIVDILKLAAASRYPGLATERDVTPGALGLAGTALAPSLLKGAMRGADPSVLRMGGGNDAELYAKALIKQSARNARRKAMLEKTRAAEKGPSGLVEHNLGKMTSNMLEREIGGSSGVRTPGRWSQYPEGKAAYDKLVQRGENLTHDVSGQFTWRGGSYTKPEQKSFLTFEDAISHINSLPWRQHPSTTSITRPQLNKYGISVGKSKDGPFVVQRDGKVIGQSDTKEGMNKIVMEAIEKLPKK